MVQIRNTHLAIVAMRGTHRPGQLTSRTRDLRGRVKRSGRARSGRCCQRCGWSTAAIAVADAAVPMALCCSDLGVLEGLFLEELSVDDAGVGAGGQAEKDEGDDKRGQAQHNNDPADAGGDEDQERDGGRAHQGIRDKHAGPVWPHQALEGKPAVLAPTQQDHAANILRPPAADAVLVHQPLFPLAFPLHAARPLDEPRVEEGHSAAAARLLDFVFAASLVSWLPVCCVGGEAGSGMNGASMTRDKSLSCASWYRGLL